MDEPLFSRRFSLEYSPNYFMRIKQVLHVHSAVVALRVIFALAIAAPITCQNEAEPYFSLSSNRTFGSGDQPSVMLSGWEVPAVQMRVYRVNDPAKFLSEMQDPHSFGGRNPRPAGKLTLLEQIHQWKRGLRRDIRLNLRGQFTESPSAHLQGPSAENQPASKATPSKETYYAQAPLLNRDQLVLSFTQPLTTKERWDSETVPIRVKDKGVFLVEAVYSKFRAYTILVVSDAVLVTKTGRAHALGYFADRNTGEPITGAEISTITRNSTLATVKTDTDGLADLTISQKAQEDLRIIATHGKDVAISNIASWAFSARERSLTGLIYTDRPVYRPGDTMHFRGILRNQEAVGYSVPAGQSVSVQITDPDGKAVYQKDLSTNSNGIVHDDLALAKASALGNYYVEVRSGESQVSGNFEVQEYKKPDYEVRVTPAKPRVIEGESVQATIDARYYFGEPVNNAKVQYSIYRTRYWYPLWYEPDEETGEESGDSGNTYDDAAGEQISQAEGKLDSDGKLTITVPTTVSDNSIDYQYRIEANVTDQAGREISGTGWLTATYGSFLVNVQPTRYIFDPGSTGTFKVQARDYENKPISTAVHVKLTRWNWRQHEETDVLASTDAATGADGSADVDLKLPGSGGSYRVTVSARTPESRMVEDSTYIWVPASGASSFYGEDEQRSVQIIPDKKSYAPGDTAKILIVAGQANTPVLVTVEGRDIRSKKLIRSQGATATFEYAVTNDDAPGFFVSAQFIRNGEMHQSQKRVKVPPEQHQLCISVATDKETYLPGQTATYNLIATAADGKPVANADLSLGVVDEAIYAIRRDTTPNLLNTFYGREYDSVYTENSLTYYFTGEAGTRRMRLAELRPPSQLAQLKPERMVQPKVRKLFPDTAFWAADIVTDASGRAQARVNFPDSLTTWRATIRGVAPENRFGSATQKTIVRKNLILRLALPRFFVQGDEITISGIVHNYLKNNKHARVSVTLAGLDLEGSSGTQEVEVPSRGDMKVDWRVKAQSVRHAKITAQALTNEESDALEFELPVNPPGVSVRQAKGGTIANSGNATFAFTFPTDAVPGSRSLSVRLSPSVAGSLFSALDYLTSFPYGCVEQTMSSFLPDLIVTKAINELGLKQPINQEQLQQKTQAGLDRLYSFQHEDGGWGWWQTDESHPFMSAYVVAGLAEAKRTGLSINENAMTRGANWVAAQLKTDKDLAPDLRAYMQYSLALAGKPDTAALGRIYGERSTLSPDGLALLGLAFEQAKDSRAAEIASQLEKSAKQTSEEAWWPASRDEMLDFEADITPEASAYAMKLISRERPASSLLPKAALWLVNHRNEGYWWSSSKQTAMVIYGLIDYVKVTKELHPDLTASVLVNGQQTATHTFSSDSIVEAPEIVLDESKLGAATNQIQVTSNGQGRLYYSVTAVHYSNAPRLEKQAAVSLNVLRDYFRLAPGKENGAIVYDLNPLDGPVQQGETIAVRLTVTGTDWRYLLVEDPIPAGTEFIERDNLYHIRNRPPWWRYWFTRRELHDDRMAIFQTYFSEGQQQYFYLLKVVNPGVFHVSPARVQPMYQPGIEATTEGRTIEAR
jgi:alpha-2-macroglobulin